MVAFFAVAIAAALNAAHPGRTLGAGNSPQDGTAGRRRHRSRHPAKSISRNIRQLTFGGQNAEAYFSADDHYLTFPASGPVLRSATQRRPSAQRSLRPDLHDARRPPDGKACDAQTDQQRQGPHHVQLFLSRRAIAFCIPRPSPRIRAARRRRTIRRATSGRSTTPTRSTPPNPTAATSAAALERARLQRRIHHHARRQAHRLHLHAQRRYRHLHDGRRRHAREAAHARTGLRWRPVLVLRRQEDRLSRRASANARADRGLQGLLSRRA